MSAAEKALPSTDLSDAFAKPSRAAGLRLPAKRPAPKPQSTVAAVKAVPDLETAVDAVSTSEAPTETADAPEVEVLVAKEATAAVEKPAAAAKKAPAKKVAAKKAAGKPNATQAQAALVLWTPKTTRARMQALRNKTGANYLDIVLDAIEDQYDNLTQLVSKATGHHEVKGRLFTRDAPGTPAVAAGERVQLTIKGARPDQLEVIKKLAKTTGAGSVSALCNAALDANLPPL